ncbi:metal ABC transporter permease [Candidatus Phytoplasma melaleucae]|uniref:Metal ABC transporter permease n=1 Tax=Candidatus Phytoplasma melaleucae TaxID=2982630 RepID=A0ABT9DD40_9MOLU|nr:metal ABC transporter permease ['Melaleuca sp.' phytoplasma]MDO8168000.1 metal ABC transporter permease ['Melaleuca sp.' phytoplasma]
MISFINNVVSGFELDVFLVILFCSLTLASLGVFLVLKKSSMVVDAMSHSVLLGIVIAFLVVKNINSPLLIMGAALVGVLTAYMVELLGKNSKVTKDASIGIVFTFFFSVAIILISLYTRHEHLDTDAVFLGNIELTHLNQLKKIIPLLCINLLFVFFFYKELKNYIFDPTLAVILGFSINLINYLLMFLVSMTAVISFDVVGSIMVISCMIGPAAISLLVTKNLCNSFLLSLWIAFVDSSIGYYLAIGLNLPVSGLIAFMNLVSFLLFFFLAPKTGIVAKIIKNNLQRKEFMIISLLMHLKNNQNQLQKNHYQEIYKDLKWPLFRYNKCLNNALKKGYIRIKNNQVILNTSGKYVLEEKIALWI